MPTNADVTQQMVDLIGKWNTYTKQLRDWLAGTATGGPYGDGRYPLQDSLGKVFYVPCPAAQSASVSSNATSASAYADAANTAKTGAEAAKSGAETARDLALTYRDAAQQARDLAQLAQSQAANSEANAHVYANQASASATDAANSAASMAQSVADAAQGAADALASANAAATTATDAATVAQAWAETPVDTEVEPGAFSAKHWATKAQAAATGSLKYKGSWDASTGAFPASPQLGDFYKVSVAGVVGSVDYKVGDQVIFNGTDWDKIDNTEQVTSVAGKLGDVQLVIADVSGLQSSLDSKLPASSYTASDVLAKLLLVDGAGSGLDADLLDGQIGAYYLAWGNLTGVPSTFAPSPHTHPISDIVGLQSALDGKFATTGGTVSGDVTTTGNVSVKGGLVTIGSNLQGLLNGYTDANGVNFLRIRAEASLWGSPYTELMIGSNGTFSFQGYNIWHAGNFSPDSKANLTGATFTGQVTASYSAFRASGWGGSATDGVVYFGNGDSWLYKNGGKFRFKNVEGGSWIAELTAGGTIWTSGNFDPNTKLDKTGGNVSGSLAAGVTGGQGYATMSGSGSTTVAGWIGFYTADGVRHGYIGNSNGGYMEIHPEQGESLHILAPTLVDGTVTAPLFLSSGGTAGEKYRVGDDVSLHDVNVANTLGLKGGQDSTKGFIRFGSDGNGFGWDGSKLAYGSATVWHSANFNPSTKQPVDSQGYPDVSKRIPSGPVQSGAPGAGWPTGASSWWHLHSTTYSDHSRYYAMQFACSFFDSNALYFRVTNGNGNTAWNRVAHTGNFKSVAASGLYGADGTDPNTMRGTLQTALANGSTTNYPGHLWVNYFNIPGVGGRDAQFAFSYSGGLAGEPGNLWYRGWSDSSAAWQSWSAVCLGVGGAGRIFVQSADPGSLASDGDLWIW